MKYHIYGYKVMNISGITTFIFFGFFLFFTIIIPQITVIIINNMANTVLYKYLRFSSIAPNLGAGYWSFPFTLNIIFLRATSITFLCKIIEDITHLAKNIVA